MHARTLTSWLATHGASCAPLTVERPGGFARAVRLALGTPAPTRRVVFAHATGNDAAYPQQALLKALLLAGCEIVAFDLDGHGRGSTSLLDPSTVRTCVHAAIAAAGWDAAGSSPHLIGESLGGALCLAAAAAPGALGGLWTPASLTLLSTPLAIEIGWRTALSELGTLLRPAFWSLAREYGLRDALPALGAFRRDRFPVRLAADAGGALGYVEVVARALKALDLEAAARAVHCPVLLVYGERDRLAPVAQAGMLAGLMTAAGAPVDLEIVPRETHFTAALTRSAIQRVTAFIAGVDR
jgi:pimeloyl-ACP methyl ester carboxylesterase